MEKVYDKKSELVITESTDNEIADLTNASCCESNVGSNSSYGWWIHWLNQNPDKMGVFPKKWFGDSLPHNTKDLIPENSILL